MTDRTDKTKTEFGPTVKQTYQYTLFSVELDPFQRDGSKIDGLDLSLRTRNKRVKQINMEQV